MELKKFIESFTLVEIRDIVIAVLVLGFLFSYASWPTIDEGMKNFAWAIVIVGFAFVLHELAHKYMAISKKCVARFVAWPMGLLLALVVGIASGGRVIFAAPGAVMISNRYMTRLGFRYVHLTREDMGKIAVMGPAINILLAFVFKGFQIFYPGSEIIQMGILINIFLATFNLLPFPPLDGSKVFNWSRILWVMLFVGSVVLLFLLPILSLFWSLIAFVIILSILFIGSVQYKTKH